MGATHTHTERKTNKVPIGVDGSSPEPRKNKVMIIRYHRTRINKTFRPFFLSGWLYCNNQTAKPFPLWPFDCIYFAGYRFSFHFTRTIHTGNGDDFR